VVGHPLEEARTSALSRLEGGRETTWCEAGGHKTANVGIRTEGSITFRRSRETDEDHLRR
jgi:hypothetical protein